MGKPSGSGSGLVTVRGTSADDKLLVPASSTLLRTTFDGGRGYDTLDLTNYSSSGVTIRLEGGYAKSKGSWATESAFLGSLYSYSSLGDSTTVRGSIKDVEAVTGTSGNDFLSGNINGVYIRLDGGDGNDSLQAWGNIAGATLIGGSGSDWFEAPHNTTTLVGGTLDATGAHGDGDMDVFSVRNNPSILDFEVGTDRLLFIPLDHSTADSFDGGSWVSNGSEGSTFMLGGQAWVTLANIPVPDTNLIEYGFVYFAENGVLWGSATDDILVCIDNAETVVVGANSGDDLLCDFDLLSDIIRFDDDLVPTWSDTVVNGLESLLGTFDGGTITITGLTTADVSAMNIQGYGGPDLLGAAAPSPWSASSDAVVPI